MVSSLFRISVQAVKTFKSFKSIPDYPQRLERLDVWNELNARAARFLYVEPILDQQVWPQQEDTHQPRHAPSAELDNLSELG
jgi:hypothetical protein